MNDDEASLVKVNGENSTSRIMVNPTSNNGNGNDNHLNEDLAVADVNKSSSTNSSQAESSATSSSSSSLSSSSLSATTSNEIGFKDFFLKLSGSYLQSVRTIREEIEEFVLSKLKKLDQSTLTETSESKFVSYHKNFLIDKLGMQVKIGETAITEGWRVPKYENEYQNLFGLPFTEDNAMKIKRPPQECFNCLASNHRIHECPVKVDEDRVALHRKIFNVQSAQAQEQAHLWSNRYISDQDSKNNRGFVPGKISEQLKEALCLRPNQLPPYIYFMRKYGYPIGWLLEAQVKKSGLTVINKPKEMNISHTSPPDEDGEIEKSDEIEYDPELIFSFPGFNEPIPNDFIDESDRYRVPRFSDEFSRERFLSKLNLRKKKQIGRRSVMDSSMKTADLKSDESGNLDENEEGEEKNVKKLKTADNQDINNSDSINTHQNVELKSDEDDDDCNNENDDNGQEEDKFSSPKRNKIRDMLGESLTEIPGTPIVDNSGGIHKLPAWEKFSDGICAHKPYEMIEVQTPMGSYKNIVKLTREFKLETNETNQS